MSHDETVAIPVDAGQITAGWLERALTERHPGVRVASVEVVARHQVTNAHAMLRVTYGEPAGAPSSLFCKLAPSGERRRAIIDSGMGHREARFYADLAPRLDLRVPAAHVARTDDDGDFVLVLEDLSAAGCLVSDGTWGLPPDAVAGALVDLAAFHQRYEDPARRASEAPWVTVSRPSLTYGGPMLRYGIDHHRDRLSDAFVAVAECYLNDHDRLQQLWHEGPPTIIHGDPHLGNVFLDGDRVGFLDWGIINVNTPLRDVGYLLTMAMSIDDRRAHDRALLQTYLDARRALRATEIGFDDAWRAYRLHAAYNVPASCQVVTFPADVSDRRRVFADAFLARAQASLDDLEVVDALRRAGL